MSYRKSPLLDQAPGTAEVITAWGGETMGGRVPAFLGLAQRTGGVFFENPPSTEEAFRQAGLDFTVVLENNQCTRITEDGVETKEVPRTRTTAAVYPDGSWEPFGPVGTRYTPIQNETIANLGQLVVDRGDGSLVAVGAYGEPVGSRVYMAFDLGGFQIGGHDPHNLALTFLGAHDGTGGLVALTAPTRVQCTNAVSGIFGRRQAGRYTIRHTESADGKVQDVREALEMTWKYVERYQDESETLLGESMTEREFLAFEHELFGVPRLEDATDRQRTMIGNRDEALVNIWRGDNSEFGRGTRWAAAQSVYEFLDWNSIVRGADAEMARWERTLAGETEDSKARTWNLLLAA